MSAVVVVVFLAGVINGLTRRLRIADVILVPSALI